MRQISDNSFKGSKHTRKQIAKHVNQTTTTWVDPEAVGTHIDLTKCSVVLFLGKLRATDWRIDSDMISTIAKKAETGKCLSSAETHKVGEIPF